jgi:hypothetical protein
LSPRLRPPGSASLSIQAPWGDETIPNSAAEVKYDRTFPVRSGTNVISISTTCPQIAAPADPRALYFNLLNPKIIW